MSRDDHNVQQAVPVGMSVGLATFDGDFVVTLRAVYDGAAGDGGITTALNPEDARNVANAMLAMADRAESARNLVEP